MKLQNIATYSMGILLASGVAFAADPPPWAWGFPGPPQAGAAQTPVAAAITDTAPHSLTGATAQYSRQQIANRFGPADWFPGDHPQMPEVVAKGRQAAGVWACSLCHYPNGKGRAENAGVNGLPVEYFIKTMNDFKNGNRKSSDPRKNNTNLMAGFAKAMTDEEIKAAAEYFGAMKWTPWIKVQESKTAPKVKGNNGLFIVEGTEMEPLGNRIIETPVNGEATEVLRDPRSGFIAYVPVGSIKKGEALVTKGGGRTMACGTCHGSDLRGVGPVPGLAGRSPSYLTRQMFDMQQGNRKGTWTELMKPVVEKLTADDMLNISAYAASLAP